MLRMVHARSRSVDRAVAMTCAVARVPRFFSEHDIELIGAVEAAHVARFGATAEARPGWRTTYVSAGNLMKELAPALWERLRVLPREFCDARLFSADGDVALAARMLGALEVRCAEVHEGSRGGALADPAHFDSGSVVTVDVLLADSFAGGAFSTSSEQGRPVEHTFERGDALIFPSYKYHSVAPIESGVRRALVLEYWNGDERRCNHRCTIANGDCSLMQLGTPPTAEEPGMWDLPGTRA